MLSFHQLLKDKKLQPKDENYLFTKLKNNIMNHSSNLEIPTDELTLEKIMQTYELDFDILKLEKAHLVAHQHEQTGKPISEIMESIKSGLSVEIENIMNKKPDEMVNTKGTNHLESTFGNTNDSISQSKPISSGQKSLSLTPKIVEFTLGGNKSISSSTKKNEIHSSEGEVSEFMAGSKGQVSKSIREKVMKGRKIK